MDIPDRFSVAVRGVYDLLLQFFAVEIRRKAEFPMCEEILALLRGRGEFVSGLARAELERVAAHGDAAAFNGLPRFFGIADEARDAAESAMRGALARWLEGPAGRLLLMRRDEAMCGSGLESCAGRNEKVTMEALAEGRFMGWSERDVPATWGHEEVVENLAYGSMPYPPAWGVLTRLRQNGWGREEGSRVRPVTAAWREEFLRELAGIVVVAFDNEATLAWVRPAAGEFSGLTRVAGEGQDALRRMRRDW
jgi:hypothetical protein